jgi:predicted O-methyltransferase YrrM
MQTDLPQAPIQPPSSNPVNNREMSYRRLAQALLEGRPYFGPALRSLQGLAIRHKYILPVVKALTRKGPIEILEVGSWAGASAISWAAALKRLGLDGHVTCVDPWLPYFDLEAQSKSAGHYARMNEAAENGAIRKLFEHNIAAAGFCGIIVTKAGKSSEVLPGLPLQSYDIVYLDGSHAFEDVLFDLREAKRLIRPGGIICGDDLELQLQDLDPAEVEAAVSQGQDFVSSTETGVDYHPGITLAVAQELGNVSNWDGFWAVRFAEGNVAQLTLDSEEGVVPEHLAESAITIEADAPAHHLISTGGRYFAVSKQFGAPDIATELLGATDLPPFIFTGSTLDEVREKLQRDDDMRAAPELIGSYREFNLVRLRKRVYGLRRSLGNVDVAIGDAEIEGRYSGQDVLIGDSVDELRARMDALTARGEAGDLLLDRTTALEERIQSLEGSLAETSEKTKHVSAQMQQIQAEIRVLTDELVARDYGPADGQPPQLLEWYREFKVVRHGNRVFGIRGSLGDVDVLASSTVLEAHFGDEDVIAGESADGVKARIDAVRAERAVRDLTARLKELENGKQ